MAQHVNILMREWLALTNTLNVEIFTCLRQIYQHKQVKCMRSLQNIYILKNKSF